METTHPDIQSLADLAESFAGGWFRRTTRHQWRVIVGDVGCGKTHVSKCLKRWADAVAFAAWESSWRGSSLPSVLFEDWMRVASPEVCDDSQFSEWIRDVDSASMVIVDDIGTESDQYRTGIPAQRLCHLLNRCEHKWLWLNTNVSPSAWSTKWDSRVEDRLLSGLTVTVAAPSFRSEKK
jgi:chromosomal replication initiation ATPase DnaA